MGGGTDSERLEAFRGAYDFGGRVHLDTAGVAPMCTPALAAVEATARAMQGGAHTVRAGLDAYDASREPIARLLGPDVTSHQVSHMQTCAAAISQVAFGLRYKPGDRIVTWDQEYPSNGYPWHAAAKRDGAEVVVVESSANWDLDTGRLIDAIDAKTRVVAVSWVQYSTGAMTDLRAVADACEKHGAWLVVDAIQGLGVIPFDMRALGVTAVCGGSHKWLTGPLGHGFLVLEEGRAEELYPLLQGAITYGTPDERTDPSKSPRTGPRRFEPGTPPMLGAAGCGAAIEHVLTAGVENLHGAAIAMADRLIAGVRSLGGEVISRTEGEGRSPIVTFSPQGDIEAADAALRAAGVSLARRGGGIRLAPHAFTTEADIDKVLEVLAE